jgi:hypothetical protein
MSDALTPSQQIVAAAAPKTEVLTDARGRKIGVRELTGLDQLRMLRAIGPGQSGNTDYGYMVECIMMVADIDGVPLVQPKNEQKIDAAMERIGDEGMAAVMLWRTQRIRAAMKAAEEAADAARAEGAPPAPDPLAQSAS